MSENDVLALLVAATATVQVTRLVLAHRRAVKTAAVKAEWQQHLKEGKS